MDLDKEIWCDIAVPMPKLEPSVFPNRDDQAPNYIYDVERNQFFHRAEDNLVVEIDFVGASQLVLSIDVRTHEVYRCNAIEFSKMQGYVDTDGKWHAQKLLWTRITKIEAQAIRRQYKRDNCRKKLMKLFGRGNRV